MFFDKKKSCGSKVCSEEKYQEKKVSWLIKLFIKNFFGKKNVSEKK